MRKKIVEDLLNLQPDISDCLERNEHVEATVEEKYQDLIKQHENLNRKYSESQELNRKQKILIEKLKQEALQLRRKCENVSASAKFLHNTLNTTFSKAQVELLCGKKKKVFWSNDDIAKAFTLRYLGKRSYTFLRSNLKFPLPHLSTLQKWASKLNFKQGILTDVLRLIQIAGINMTSFEKVAVIDFDEVKVECVYEYDKTNDEIIGPHKQMQVIMVRGLFSQWKQPIYIDFDQKITQEILNKVLTKLYSIGFNVVACVADCGGGNVGLWKILGISPEKSYFLHPISGKNIYFFPDVPHLLKLVRNWLVDTGFILPDGSMINKKPLYDLLELTNHELSVCHRLTKKHLECEKCERHNVALAAQLLSHTTATALIHYEPGMNKKLARDTGKFVDIVSNWFDLMNAYTPAERLCTKKPYGMNLVQQNETLEKMYQMALTMKCVGKRSLQTFQKAILMSIASTKLLMQDMKEIYNCTYILTNRLNQDCLESFFSQLRSKGGLHDHPSPLNSIYRIRMIVLGKNPGALQRNLNIQNTENCQGEYLIGHVFREVGVIPTMQENTEEPTSDCSLSSSSTVDSVKHSPPLNEDEGFIWLCGWIARKFKQKYPSMGTYTKDLKTKKIPELAYNTELTWIQHLSFGGLTEPSEEWVQQAKKMENVFLRYNENQFGKHKKS